MNINVDRLKTALSLISKEDNQFVIRSNFISFTTNVKFNSLHKHDYAERIEKFVGFINSDLSDIHNIIERMNFQLELWKKYNITISEWIGFTKLDIELFHIKIRSIFDYIAKIIQRASDLPEQVPDKSFQDIKEWLEKNEENKIKLGPELADLFSHCEWFAYIKETRDWDIHRGAEAAVFLNQDRIVFQIYRSTLEKSVDISEIMYNENIAFFDFYAGLYTGYLLAFLEEVSDVITRKICLKNFGGNPRQVYNSKPKSYQWIELLFEKKTQLS